MSVNSQFQPPKQATPSKLYYVKKESGEVILVPADGGDDGDEGDEGVRGDS